MKKSLSILLTLLMILGTVTCAFTMPVSAATESGSTKDSVTEESLPINGIDVANSDNEWLRMFPLTVPNNDLGIAKMIHRNPYQLEFTVTTDADLPAGVKLYVDLYNRDETTAGNYSNFVGIRYETSNPGDVRTAYEYQESSAAMSADKAAELEAGKTYKYVYIIYPHLSNNCAFKLNYVGGEGNVTISDPYLCNLTDTQWNEFFYKGKEIVRYLVKENGRVFQRMYGYRTLAESNAGTTTANAYRLSAKNGSRLYDMLFQANKTYTVDFDMRVPAGAPNPTTGSTHTAAFNVFETMPSGILYADAQPYHIMYKDAYEEAFGDIDSAYINSNSTRFNYNNIAYWAQDYTTPVGSNTGQTIFNEQITAYSYNWSSADTATTVRRYKATGTMSSVDYYNSTTGAKIASATSSSSAAGRGLASSISKNDAWRDWIDTKYTLNTISGQKPLDDNRYTGEDVKEAYNDVYSQNPSTAANFRYKFDSATNAWVVQNNNAKNTLAMPATDDARVGFAIDYFGKGYVYDFDDIEVNTVISTPEIKILDKFGNPTTLSAADNSLAITALGNVTTGKANITITGYEERDALTFKGFEKNDVIVSTDGNLSIDLEDYDASDYKAVFVYENLMSKTGGYEDVTTSFWLGLEYDTVQNTYSFDYNGDGTITSDEILTKTVYNQAPDDSNKWGYFTLGDRLGTKHPYDATNYPFTAPAGSWGDANGYSFGSLIDSISFNDSNGVRQTATPHTGKGALILYRMGGREPVKALTGLTPGKTYKVSFYTLAPTINDYINSVSIATTFLGVFNGKILAINNTNSYNGQAFDIGQTVLNTNSYTLSEDEVGKWVKREITFTASKETEYLHLNGAGDPLNNNANTKLNVCYADDFCMVPVERNKTSWDFEDGDTTDVFTGGPGAYSNLKDAVGAPKKIGNKYLLYSNNRDASGLTFNFNYNSTDKYYISFDMKVIKYSTYNNGLQFALAPANDGTNAIYNHTSAETIALNNPEDNIIRRWKESGDIIDVRHFNQSISTNVEVNGATKYLNGACFYGQTPETSKFDSFGGNVWDDWQHFEIEIDPNGNNYSGDVEFTFLANQAGWQIGIDNFTVTRRSMTALNQVDSATVGTSKYNIRPASYNAGQGLRFKSTIDLSVRDNEIADGAKVVEYGTLAMLADTYTNNNELVLEMAGKNVVAGKAYVEGKTDLQFSNDGTKITYTGVLTEIGVKHYKVNWAVRGYAVLKYADGTTEVVYDDVRVLSVYDAAQNIIATVANNHPDYAAAKKVIDDFAEYTDMQYAAQTKTLSEIQNNLKLNSRAAIDGGSLKMEWSYSGFTMQGQFSGDIVLTDVVRYQNILAYCVVDGDYENKKELNITTNGDVTIATGLAPGFHSIEFFKASESYTLNAKGIKYNGTLSEKPAEKALKIQVIGDSIGSGSGLLPAAQAGDIHMSDISHSYGMQIARNYNAEFSVISTSGGSCGTKAPKMNEKYLDTFVSKTDKYDFSKEAQPDLIIIGLGTNDTPTYLPVEQNGGGVDTAVLTNYIKEMLTMVRSKNPNATIVWSYGMMATAIKEVYQNAVEEFAATDGNTYYTFTTCNDKSGINGHPTAAGHDNITEQLISFIDSNQLLNPYTEEKYTVLNALDTQAYSKSIQNVGNNTRIANLMEEASQGGTYTIAVLGGSISWGAGAKNIEGSYGYLVKDWWEKNFPQATFNYVSAGIGSSNPEMACYRLDTDLLAYNPDFVVIDFSVNTYLDNDVSNTYDTLVNRVLNHESQPALMAIQFTQTKTETVNGKVVYSPTKDFPGPDITQCIRKYDLPSISYHNYIWENINNQIITWTDISDDDIHPNSTGHNIAAHLIYGHLDYVKAEKDNLVGTAPAVPTISSTDYTGWNYITSGNTSAVATNFSTTNTDGMRKYHSWTTTTNGATLTVTLPENVQEIRLIYSCGTGTGTFVITGNGTEPAISIDASTVRSPKVRSIPITQGNQLTFTSNITGSTVYIIGIAYK